MSLARAFLYIGARAVVATLWPVTDLGAKQFTTAMFERWMAGKKSIRVAFRETQSEHKEEPAISQAFTLSEA